MNEFPIFHNDKLVNTIIDFDLEGDKIVMKESGQYKTAIGFTQIGEIDGVAPTDLQDAYDKLLVLVENFNGGGGRPEQPQHFSK